MNRITIVCSDPEHPVMPHLRAWQAAQPEGTTEIHHRVADVGEGTFLFLISCTEIVRPDVRARFDHTLVVHASDLPRGRGWAPYVWSILEGADELCVTLLDADDPVDSGDIWQQIRVPLDGSELHDEIFEKLFAAELALMDWAVAHCATERPTPQSGEPTYYPRRTPADSEVSVEQRLVDIFDLLRVADPDRYPAFFHHRGHRYVITLEKADPGG
jgi:methionyl-tRNA formyltransferase